MEEEILQQMSLWDYIYPKKKIEKPIRLIEFFAGIGSQFKALKQLTNQVESWKICEWAYNSYCCYNAIHIKDFTDYAKDLTKDELIKRISGTSMNYNDPLTDKQLSKKPIEWLRNAYNNCVATHNLINIMNVHGKDLEIVDTDKYEYILTYSFPCQDLSLAGKRQGMATSQKYGGTRSGLLWEVERILTELEREREHSTLPHILLMENVPEVVGQANINDFVKWQNRLEELGYKNYVEILNAKNYGIPQNRRRCFMVSILGDYAYNFPIKLKREYRLKDLLEKIVSKKYYLTNEHIERISNWKAQQKPLENMINLTGGADTTTPTLTARGAGEEHSGMVLIEESEVMDFDNKPVEQRGGGSNLRIRKLTPLETMRLMGFTDEDYQAMRDIGMSDAAIYHMAGDSIVVTVLMSIFSTLMFDDDRHTKIVKDYIKKGIIENK